MINKSLLFEYLSEDLNKIKEMIKSSLFSDIELLNKTNDTLLSHPGKMMRPALALLVAKACSGGMLTEDSYAFATASELLHNATLLHDDVADNSSSRRGRPTVMKLLGGNAAVLLGDFWLVRAVDKILKADHHRDEAMDMFAKTLSNLAEGEMIQLQKAMSADLVEEEYFRIIYNKTASLFEAAAVTAALSVDADERYVEAVREFSRNLGLAFQIKDDIFDYDPSVDIGKPVGHDLTEQKITLPLLCAFKNASAEETALIREKVSHIHENPSYQEEIVVFVEDRNGVNLAKEILEEYVNKAVKALDILPKSKDRELLESLAQYTASRIS